MDKTQYLNIGTQLQGGKYRIEKVLGQGGFGITYLAYYDLMDSRVVVKEFFFKQFCERSSDTRTITLGTQSNEGLVNRYLEKFVKEAKTIFRLEHNNIVKIYDVFMENNTAYYVMEYVEGASLGQMVAEHAMSQDIALGYISQVADALSYIHSKNINHLDVKPNNVMVRRSDGKAVLIDFGVAKQYDGDTGQGTTTTPVGVSHGYSPSEQYKKNGVQSFSPQSDVYALAATLFKLLTGITPPEASDILENGVPVNELKKRGVTTDVIDAIVAAMRPSRRERTQSIALFVKALTKGAKAEDASAPKPKPALVHEDDGDTLIMGEDKPKPASAPKMVAYPAPKARQESKPRAVSQSPKPSPSKTGTAKPKSSMKWVMYVIGIIVVGGIIGIAISLSSSDKGKEIGYEIVKMEQDLKSSGKDNQEEETQGKDIVVKDDKGKILGKWTGEMKNGKPHGKGVLKYDNGDKFDGTMKNGVLDNGRFDSKEADMYFIGKFNGFETGEGKWYDASTGEEV